MLVAAAVASRLGSSGMTPHEPTVAIEPEQAAAIFAEFAALRVVQEVREDESGAALGFQQGGQGRLALGDANYATHLRLARRSQERQHPVGVTFGEGQTITEIIRAHNDVPSQLWEEEPGQARVLFQGHDGVFRLRPEHPEAARLRAELGEALRQKARVWFIAQKPNLTLLDVLPDNESISKTADRANGALL